MTVARTARMDWSGPIAEILFGKEKRSIHIASQSQLESLLDQARANKVIARILPRTESNDSETNTELEKARAESRNRLQDALRLLNEAQKVCLDIGVPFTVIKSLDGVPDIGHDVDLLVGKNLQRVRSRLLSQFQCDTVTLTFCDRHAGKFSTFIRGFDSDFELYTRISQLGEEYYPEEDVLGRRREESVQGSKTFLCSQEDRLLITCIHTLYRHGKIRLSDLKVAHDALRSRIDSRLVMNTIEDAGIGKGFAVFLEILQRMGKEILGEDLVPDEFRHYSKTIVDRDRILRLLLKQIKPRFPLKMPVPLVTLLFLQKAAHDLVQNRLGSSLRALLAPVLLLIDKSVPLRIQKAISVRIW